MKMCRGRRIEGQRARALSNGKSIQVGKRATYLCENDDSKDGEEGDDDHERHAGAFPRPPRALLAALLRNPGRLGLF